MFQLCRNPLSVWSSKAEMDGPDTPVDQPIYSVGAHRSSPAEWAAAAGSCDHA